MTEFTLGRLGDRYAVTWYEGAKRIRFRFAARSLKEAEAQARVDFERAQMNLRMGSGPSERRAVLSIDSGLRKALTEAREAALTGYVIEWACKPLKPIKRRRDCGPRGCYAPHPAAHFNRADG